MASTGTSATRWTPPVKSSASWPFPTTLASAGPSISTSLSSELLATHIVEVGAFGRLLFNPAYVTAAVGDTVRFLFRAGNHTLTQSTLNNPCSPANGFDTSFHQLNPSNSSNLVVDLFVNNTEPQWFFCHQAIPAPHCHLGMVFALNPGNAMDTFLANVAERAVTTGSCSLSNYSYSALGTGTSSITPKVIRSLPTGIFTPTSGVDRVRIRFTLLKVFVSICVFWIGVISYLLGL